MLFDLLQLLLLPLEFCLSTCRNFHILPRGATLIRNASNLLLITLRGVLFSVFVDFFQLFLFCVSGLGEGEVVEEFEEEEQEGQDQEYNPESYQNIRYNLPEHITILQLIHLIFL